MSVSAISKIKLIDPKVLEKDPRAEVFKKLYEENEILKFNTFKEFAMCLGLSILYMSLLKSGYLADVSFNFKKALTKHPFPPDRYIMTYIVLKNLSGELVTKDGLHQAIIDYRQSDELSSRQLDNILNFLTDECGVLKKGRGITNCHTGKFDKRRAYYTFANEHLKDWIQFHMLVFGMDRQDLNNYTEGRWSTTENDWLFHYIGWQNTDPDEYDEQMRSFIKAVKKL
jgi:hypothetical protein